MTQQSLPLKAYPARQAARPSVAIMLISITAIAIGLLFFVSLTYFKSLDREAAQTRLLLYKRSLNDTIERYQHLPFVLARDPLVSGALSGSTVDALNPRLASFAREAGLEAIYLMDRSGLVVAASNFDKEQTFVGQNYGFRPYFKQAISGIRGNYFGVGVTTGRPGYFVSEPVRNGADAIIGVIAIKLDASELQQTWENGGENVLASNPDGIVVLASNRDWLFRTIEPVSPARLTAIRQSKQFGAIAVEPLAWSRPDGASVELGERTYIYAGSQSDHLDWQLHYLLSEARAYERAWLATIVFGSAISLLVGFAAYQRSKRIQAALLTSQSDRDQLREANRRLEKAHSELARSSKLAALGQISASVVHELGQPISAFRNYLTAEELVNNGISHPTLAKLNAVAARMENITRQLRFFTKPGDEKIERVMLGDVLSGCMELMQHDFELANVRVRQHIAEPDLAVMGNRLRLEQVLVNLMQNGLYALQEASGDCLTISVSRSEDEVAIAVEDNGSGFGERQLNQLQEPFHTTRASGDGMGLGLSIASGIIKEHDGTLSAQSLPGGGAVFTIHLPIAPPIDQPASYPASRPTS